MMQALHIYKKGPQLDILQGFYIFRERARVRERARARESESERE